LPDPTPAQARAAPGPWFEDRSDLLGHHHLEDPWDDFALQPSLPKALSRAGPALAWFDLDGDGHDDLIVGGSRGQAPALFRNDPGGRLALVPGAFPQVLADDTAGLLGWSPAPGQRQILAGVARVDPPTAAGYAGLAWSLAPSGLQPPTGFAPAAISAGPLALGDIAGDGSLDLFLGGRFVPGRYPEPAPSMLLRNRAGRLEPDAAASKAFDRLGLVTAAVFSDLSGNGHPELVVAREWGTIEIFTFAKGQPRKAGPELQLPPLTGLWTSIATADFDGDGRLDIVAGNWGLNSVYQQTAPGPWRLYYGDLNRDGGVQILEAYREPGTGQIRPWRDMTVVERFLPWVRARHPTHRGYAQAEIAGILGDRLGHARTLEITHLASTVFLRRDNGWEVRPLPAEAQWSPVMGIVVADFDADGHEDLFLSQNFFAVRPDDARLDAGRGLVLKGDGQGGFRPLTGQESGILIYGEQRACAAADYDGDGRVDLAVAQNDGPLRLLRNVSENPGLRVRMHGPPANPSGIGARIRVVYADGTRGPVREVQSGSGFWSQNSATQILGLARQPAALEVVWPGGRAQTHAVQSGDRTVTIR
jgi:enediyne biosynthesis protein E4